MSDLTRLPLWPFILILGYPIVAIAVLEFGRRLTSRAPFTSGILRQVAYVLLPTGAMRLILRVLAGLPANDSLVVAGQLAVMVPRDQDEIRLELVGPGQLMVFQQMLAGGSSPVRVLADQDTDVLTIPAQPLIDAMDHSRVVARDICAVAEARRQASLPLNRGLRVCCLKRHPANVESMSISRRATWTPAWSAD